MVIRGTIEEAKLNINHGHQHFVRLFDVNNSAEEHMIPIPTSFADAFPGATGSAEIHFLCFFYVYTSAANPGTAGCSELLSNQFYVYFNSGKMAIGTKVVRVT